jgi:hypothetical protein
MSDRRLRDECVTLLLAMALQRFRLVPAGDAAVEPLLRSPCARKRVFR